MEDLDIKELFNIFWSRKIYVILIVLIFLVIGCVYTLFFVTPRYKASTTLVLTSSKDDTSSSITNTDISMNNNLVSTYSVVIKSANVVGKVKDNLRLTKSESAIRNSISVSAVKSSQAIQIDVVDVDPKTAQVIANELAEVFSQTVADMYKINNVYILDKAEVPTGPYNISHAKDVLMFIAAGVVVAAAYVLIANMVDTTVKSADDVEKKTGLSVLVSIPLCNFDETPKVMRKGGRK